MALTERDLPAYNFLKKFRMAKLTQIDRVAYKHYVVCSARMNRLERDGLLFKRKNPIEQGVLYGFTKINLKSMRNYFHTMIVNETYLAFLENTIVHDVDVERIYGNIQVDMTIQGEYDGKPYFYLVEVETDRNGGNPNYEKYNMFLISEWREHFDTKPTVLYVTNKKLNESKIEFPYKKVDTKLNTFNDMIKGPTL